MEPGESVVVTVVSGEQEADIVSRLRQDIERDGCIIPNFVW